MVTNYSAWVSNTASADQAYGNALADNGVTAVASTASAEEGVSNITIVNGTAELHAATGLDVTFVAMTGQAITNAAGTVAGHFSGTPYTAPTSTLSWTQSTGGTFDGNGNVAYGNQNSAPPAGQTSGVPAQSRQTRTNPDGSVDIGIDVNGDGVIDFWLANGMSFNGSVYIPGDVNQLLKVLGHLGEIVQLNQAIDALIAQRVSLQAQLQAEIDDLEDGFAPEGAINPGDPAEQRRLHQDRIRDLQQPLQGVINELNALFAQLHELETALGVGGVTFTGRRWNHHGSSVATGLRNLDKVFGNALDKHTHDDDGIVGVTIQDLATASAVYGLGRLAAGLAGQLTTTRIVFRENRLNHIFRPVHNLANTQTNRSLLQSIAGDAANFVGKPPHGTDVIAKILPDGSQIWIYVRNGQIFDAGRNLIPRTLP